MTEPTPPPALDGRTPEPFLSREDAAVLNTARRVLEGITRRATFDHNSQASGRVASLAETAADVVFAVLNHASSYGGDASAAWAIELRNVERASEARVAADARS